MAHRLSHLSRARISLSHSDVSRLDITEPEGGLGDPGPSGARQRVRRCAGRRRERRARCARQVVQGAVRRERGGAARGVARDLGDVGRELRGAERSGGR